MSTFKQYRIALQIFQSNRLRRDYRDLAEIPQYEPVGEFFFNEIYGPRDFTERDRGARRLHQFIHALPGVRLRDVEEVLDLLDLTNRLDDGLALMMLEHKVGTDFDEATYERFYYLADNYDERLKQLELVRSSLYNVFRLSRSHLLGIGLHRSRLLARLLGMEAAHEFLVKGYDALQGVISIDHFAVTVHDRELARLNRIYGRDA
ncbi:MAG: FFLEELY motif protein [Chloroflexaceae bacterium]